MPNRADQLHTLGDAFVPEAENPPNIPNPYLLVFMLNEVKYVLLSCLPASFSQTCLAKAHQMTGHAAFPR